MGTITQRKRADGTSVYTAQIRLKKDGIVVHSEAQSFTKKALASEWMRRREVDLQAKRARGEPFSSTLTVSELIKDYQKSSQNVTQWGITKSSDIKRLQSCGLAEMRADKITALDIIQFIGERRLVDGAGPATALNDVIWLRQVFLSAVTRHNLTGPLAAVDAAKADLLQSRTIAKPRQRIRRLQPHEEQAILDRYDRTDGRAEIPMASIIRFALLTARRQEEVCSLRWDDVDFEKGIGWLDDVKHPKYKMGNRRSFRLLDAAAEIVKAQARTEDPRVFPYNSKSVSASFTRTCHLLEIKDLHFHDLRHEATSRLFERGYSIQEVAQFTLHDSWATLKRYTHLKPENVPER
jgi:integrase